MRGTGDQESESSTNHSRTSSNSDTSRENVADSDMKSASGDCLIWSDTDEVTVRTASKR